MKFILTTHAIKRMKQRNIPNPEELYLLPAKNKIKKLIRKRCKKSGFQKGLIYWKSSDSRSGVIPIYVCSIEGKGLYKVITVFNLYL